MESQGCPALLATTVLKVGGALGRPFASFPEILGVSSPCCDLPRYPSATAVPSWHLVGPGGQEEAAGVPALPRGTLLHWLRAESTLGALQPWVSSVTILSPHPAVGWDVLGEFFFSTCLRPRGVSWLQVLLFWRCPEPDAHGWPHWSPVSPGSLLSPGLQEATAVSPGFPRAPLPGTAVPALPAGSLL